MRILLLAPHNYDFTAAIANEMKLRGYDVTCLEDKTFGNDYLLSYHNITKRWIKYLIGRSTKKKSKYWQSQFKNNPDLLEVFDVLLCINGYSICEEFFHLLKKISPKIKTVYYLWDSCMLYAFNFNFKNFDRCVTFDFEDAKKFKIEYLPMFWIPDKTDKPNNISAFFIGTIHSDRYYILRKLIMQLNNMRIPHYIRLYIPKKQGLMFTIRYYLEKITGLKTINANIYEILHHILPCDFMINEHITLSEFNNRLGQATHIIDIEQPCQTAITPRVIQALAENKKIITTNEWLKKTCFYSASQICIIDRKEPHLPEDFFLKCNKVENLPEGIYELRIDNWLNTLLDLW